MTRRRAVTAVAMLLLAGCEVVEPEPTTLDFEAGPLTWGPCVDGVCEAVIQAKNLGPGCALSPYGVTWFADANRMLVAMGEWQRTGVIWRTDVFVYRVPGIAAELKGVIRYYQTRGYWFPWQCGQEP